ncbi:TetR family transcriptional regulator [Nocardia sp. 004]|uniref:TetR/AcrR family transcriptional regulator n=1 Tax=Nocardia sp. 004 TaxID=3385978 RepID=UPI0039A373B7
MYSQQPVSQGPAEDLTTAARIRDTAIELFGEHGFQVGIRKIAAAAGVSPGLVNHHFGSKDGLRAACDARVLHLIRDEKIKALTASSVAMNMLDALAEIDSYAPLFAYMMRSLQAGGPMAESLLEDMISDTAEYLRQGVEAGNVKPSRDPVARARYLVMLNVGATLLSMQMRLHRGEEIDYRKALRELSNEITLPALELYTQGLLTDPTILDTFIKEQ